MLPAPWLSIMNAKKVRVPPGRGGISPEHNINHAGRFAGDEKEGLAEAMRVSETD
jgi:hypothetical protein